MKTLTCAVGALLTLVAVACGSKTSTTGTPTAASGTASATSSSGQGGAGTGGATSAGGATAGQGGAAATGAGGAAATGGAGGGNPPGCLHCADYITMMGGDPSKLCPSSAPIAKAVLDCGCTKCATECVDSCKNMKAPPQACQTCGFAKCMNEINACFADK